MSKPQPLFWRFIISAILAVLSHFFQFTEENVQEIATQAVTLLVMLSAWFKVTPVLPEKKNV